MRVLFFNPENYVNFENEPSYYELRLPILNCGIDISFRDYVYQRVLRREGRDMMNERAIQETRDFKPDIVVYSTTCAEDLLDPYVLQEIIKYDIPVYTHIWDTWVKSRPHELELFLNCTYLGVGESATNYLFYRSLAEDNPQIKGVIFTPGHNVFTDLIHKKDLPKIYDVTLIGSNEARRVQLIQYLKKNLADYGISLNKCGGLNDSTKWAPQKGLKLNDQWLPWDKYVDIINQSKICINSQTDPTRNQIKGKIFDYMSCGTLCLCDANPEVRLIVPDECLVYYDSMEDCLNKILYYLEHEDERASIANTGYSWYHETFDYKRFWSRFLRAAVLGEGDLPTLPSLQDEYCRIRKSNVPLLFLSSLHQN